MSINKTLTRSAALLGATAALAGTAVFTAGSASAATAKPGVDNECFTHDVYTITGSGINIHQNHYTGSAGGVIFGLGYSGQEFDSTQTTTIIDDGYHWEYGEDMNTGVHGWMVTAYLRFDYNDGTCLN